MDSGSPAYLFLGTFQQFGYQFVAFIPKILAALIIWVIGKYFLSMGISALERIKVGKAKGVNKDYLGIGRTVIDSFLSGLSFAVAIALGLAFGKALEPDVKQLVENFKAQLEK
jgi:putative Mn2+ efflux pump MntP